ncbi:hypothetical protein BGW80DRAFT_242979 [Lactifluus volemus]|nr:hypothetical protein BGW80DRAFT_242979 [Lactifluus volemus]
MHHISEKQAKTYSTNCEVTDPRQMKRFVEKTYCRRALGERLRAAAGRSHCRSLNSHDEEHPSRSSGPTRHPRRCLGMFFPHHFLSSLHHTGDHPRVLLLAGGLLIQHGVHPRTALQRRVCRSLCYDELFLVCFFWLGGICHTLSVRTIP